MECLQHAFRALLPILILILITICIPWETLIEGLQEWRGQGEGNGVETHYNRVIDTVFNIRYCGYFLNFSGSI